MTVLTVAPTEIYESGDSALRVVAISQANEDNWLTVHRLADWLESCGAEGLYGAVPTYDSVLVEFDPILVSARQVRAFVKLGLLELGHAAEGAQAPREFDVPVVYGGDFGPDLELVAEHQGISTGEVIRLHTEKTYTVRCLGAPAGSPMMDGPAFPRPVPRLKDPRLSVPAGAVSVAGRQAVIAPAAAPGGWCVIGQTPLSVLNIRKEPLVPYKPGDILRFRQIRSEDFNDFVGRELEPLELERLP
ncbi:allophanate hydrolase [Arthrobacter sp. StoSoilB3]|jgi:KipI family sensor histidine kinase inhibitor|uniref:5-oxoprolinase subunit B family protein n=1 Tax=Paenarthrobacter TaxID=1742992 RepID=UPI00036A45B5|nr:carboxyltransferase domain-containing protein [Paenarthrobacter nicotinovorans]BCW12546.1 allophanate hydrolase [Arthrobacter sp. NtRootA2]BCW16628.1 allophanate hydrolase [Arthrobacter sp. NtRootA4]BCW24961.1 allophanate hydrolase [Arthrobacter sp. NtRootC7]BCW29230.1 allophanate hydrolase [Arthrobacter sp. NtRootC45]BCW33501.1 allophanate hydrolase [Arthrobacter sp. NtRootD5]BCW42370.1 allophanate hydrolase [Arthrobacter sp. StoSoilB3]